MYIYIYKTLFRTSQRTLSISVTNTSRFMLCMLRNSQILHLNCTVCLKFSVKPSSIKFRIIPFGNSVLVTCRQTDRQAREATKVALQPIMAVSPNSAFGVVCITENGFQVPLQACPQQMWNFCVTQPSVLVNILCTHQIKYRNCGTGRRYFCLSIFSRCGVRRFAPYLYVSGLA
jgi:hypothetical protein